MYPVKEISDLREKYGKLHIIEARKTYDNDMYLLISGKFILGIEYVLNSNYSNSVQEFRVIEDIHGSRKSEFDEFNQLDLVKLKYSQRNLI